MDNLRQIIREHILEGRDFKTDPDVLIGNNIDSTDQLIDQIINSFKELRGQDLEPYKSMLQNMFRTIRQVDTGQETDLGLAEA